MRVKAAWGPHREARLAAGVAILVAEMVAVARAAEAKGMVATEVAMEVWAAKRVAATVVATVEAAVVATVVAATAAVETVAASVVEMGVGGSSAPRNRRSRCRMRTTRRRCRAEEGSAARGENDGRSRQTTAARDAASVAEVSRSPVPAASA